MWTSAFREGSTRCYSSSLIRLLQPRVRGRGLPCLTPLAGGVVIGQEGGCTSPDKNGRCRDCLVWDVDKACRIELPVLVEYSVNTRLRTHMYSLQRGTRDLRHRCVSLLRKKTKSTRQTEKLRTSMAHCVPMPNAGVRCARARWVRDMP